MKLLLPFLALLAVALAGGPSLGQCDAQWQLGDGIRGTNDDVRCVTEWDPDGSGPRGPVLVAGGTFTIAGKVAAGKIAMWDGSSWASMNGGITAPSFSNISALAVLPTGELVAAGLFTEAGGFLANNIARWNGTHWLPMGGGLNGGVSCLVVLPNGNLIAGGPFNGSGAVPLDRVARWDGANWVPVGSGIPLGFRVWRLAALANGDIVAANGNPEFLGQQSQRIMRFDGNTWQPLGGGITNGPVRALAVLTNGDLIAGGEFVLGPRIVSLARWNGTEWTGVGGEADITGSVYSLAPTRDGGFVVSGLPFEIREAPDAAPFVRGTAHWIAGEWDALGLRANGLSYSQCLLERQGGTLIAGGGFLSVFTTNSSFTAHNIAQRDSTGWSNVGTSPLAGLGSLAIMQNGDLLATSGSSHPGTVARRTASGWVTLGAASSGTINAAAAMPNGEVIAGGSFASINGVAATNVARWDGSQWYAMGSGTNGSIYNVVALPNGNAMIAGSFSSAGGVPIVNLAIWNGTEFAHAGITFVVGDSARHLALGPDGTLMLVWQRGQTNSIWSWTLAGGWVHRGAWAWSDYSGNGPGYINSAALLPNGDLVIAGYLHGLLPGMGTIAVRRNGVFMPIGLPSSGFGSWTFGQLPNGDFFASSSATSDPLPSGEERLSRWTGSNWAPFGDAFNGSVGPLLTLPNGNFVTSGALSFSDGHVSTGVLDLHVQGAPRFTQQPRTTDICVRNRPTVRASVASANALNLRWEARSGLFGWQPLSTTPISLPCASGGSMMVAASAPSAPETQLVISGCGRIHDLLVRCVATTSCTAVSSETVNIHHCIADWNCSESTSANDIFDYISDWFAGVSECNVNGDAVIDVIDLYNFVGFWFEGC